MGTPEPTEVNRSPVEGKCILISGHDLVCTRKLLEAIEKRKAPVNVFTHGELFNAPSYPELRKFKNLVGNFGEPWYD